MKCPCCGNEMQSGFVRAMGRGGVCWVTENRPMGAAVGCPGFLLLGKAPHSETDHVPAQRCAACRMVTIAYDPEYHRWPGQRGGGDLVRSAGAL